MNLMKRKSLLLIAILNVMLVIIGCAIIFNTHQDNITLYDIPLYTSEGLYDDGNGNTFSTDYPASHYWFAIKTPSLQSGIYDVTVFNSANRGDYSISFVGKTNGSHYPSIYAGTPNSLYQNRIWVNSKIDYLYIRIDCGEEGNEEDFFQTNSHISIDKIEIIRDRQMSVSYSLIKLLAFLSVLDGIFVVWWNIGRIKENIYVILGLVCIFIISSLGVMGGFQIVGHDALFHAARIVGLAQELSAGNFPVRIQPNWLSGYGYAVSVCYGDTLLYIPAVLYTMGVPLTLLHKAYILFINLGTVLISYFCYKKISGDKYIGVICSALYCLSICRLLNIYTRSALGEYSAFMFLPLVLLGIKHIYSKDSDVKDRNGWLLLCIGMTGIIQTHIISLEMVCIFIAIAVVILIKKFSKNVFIAFIKSVLASLFLNLGFLLPFVDYSTDHLYAFAPKNDYGIQQYGLSIYELFSFSTTGNGRAYTSFAGLPNKIPESLGLAMLTMLLLTVIVFAKCQTWKKNEKRELLLMMGLGGMALLMSTYYFPWNRLAAISPLKNVVASIQYPWRFLSIGIPLLTYMAGLVLAKLKDMIGEKSARWLGLLVGICLIGAFQGLYCIDVISRSVESSVCYDNNADLDYAVMGGEYLLADTDINLLWGNADITGENIQIQSTERKGTQFKVSCQAGENAWIELPMLAYKHYQCIDMDTGQIYAITRGENNRVHVVVPDNYNGTFRVHFAEPWYWRLSEMISVLTFIIICIGVGRRCYRKGFIWRHNMP